MNAEGNSKGTKNLFALRLPIEQSKILPTNGLGFAQTPSEFVSITRLVNKREADRRRRPQNNWQRLTTETCKVIFRRRTQRWLDLLV